MMEMPPFNPNTKLNHFRCICVSVVLLMFHVGPALADTQLFSNGWQDSKGGVVWATRFGDFEGDAFTINGVSGVATAPGSQFAHAEAQRLSFLGVDFIYSAQISVSANAEAHLQFRISDMGRYGVRTRPDSITLYRFLREDEACSTNDPSATSHCPSFASTDNLIYRELATCSFGQPGCACKVPILAALHQVSISAQGNSFVVSLDGVQCLVLQDQTAGNQLLTGRFGIYLYGLPEALNGAIFKGVTVTTDPSALSNFALLYSAAGYEAGETKRALVRTLNDMPLSMLDAAHSKFTVYQGGTAILSAPLVPLLEPGNQDLAKTFGMQLLEADFSSIQSEGDYAIRVDIATANGLRTLTSSSFKIGSHLVSQQILHSISVQNAEARRAADEDMRRNWCFENPTNGCTNNPAFGPTWSVTEDGAFLADRADSGAGAVVRRVFNQNNGPLSSATYFHYIGEVTIVSGCDAQMQFAVTPSSRWAVTLQAGAAGGCAFGGGPGAVRVHYEDGTGFHVVAASLFPTANPFVAGHPYDVDITVQSGKINVLIDGGLVQLNNIAGPTQPLGFALKAWASTARFRRVQAWNVDVLLSKSSDGTRIPHYAASIQNGASSSLAWVPCESWLPTVPTPINPQTESDACNPFFSQFSGFHDCNNLIGEATSHGAFLAGLMEVWTRRAGAMSQSDRELLRRDIITDALYLEGLYQEAGETGEFAHSEMGRGGVDTNLGPWLTQTALYGESAFADGGSAVDPRLAQLACSRSIQSAAWLDQHQDLGDPTQRSVVYAHIAKCASRLGLPGTDGFWSQAIAAAQQVVNNFSQPGFLASQPRDTARVYPWFEGVYEVAMARPDTLSGWQGQLRWIASLLVNHLANNHVCNDGEMSGTRCPKNGFLVLPQASGTIAGTPASFIPVTNWNDMQSVPMVNRVAGLPYVHFYSVPHFAVAASDAAYLAQLTGAKALEPIASANLNWSFGLNPGVSVAKSASSDSSQPWQSASFTYNGTIPSVRTIDGWRTPESSSKGWLSLPREVSAASPHHETWWIDPANNGFTSLVNGHVIWDGQWDYVSSGGAIGSDGNWFNVGWSSGETFLLDDGVFIKAALLFEDWMNATAAIQANPYATHQVAFFDTTHIDRLSTDWAFDDPDTAQYALASRASTDFCDGKGFNGGLFTGHFIGEHLGLLCTPDTASFFDIAQAEIDATASSFSDINAANWVQVARSATSICSARGFVGGFFTGHQLNGLHGIVCLRGDTAHLINASQSDLQASGFAFSDINTVGWAQAARAATNICTKNNYSGGFFTGNELNGELGLACLAQ